MAFRNIPPNGFPALPDVEDLEAVVKDVTALKTSVSGLTEDVSDLNEQKANQITIAPFFNSETSYDIGDLVYYNGLTYRCTNAHEGEWDADDFVGTTIANELDSLRSGLTNNSVNLTTSELFQIINQGSHMITSGVLHVFAKIKCVALPAEGVNDFDFVFTPSGTEIVLNQRGIVINVGKVSSEWVTPSNLVYGFVGTSSISGHTSDLTVGSYYLIDVIIKLAVN